ncbi:hypothetical protein BJ322DRAFT_1106725 [Thelephora terrestris]|uniref:Uncharacterized protein n=1 Tax=Thelephora terrestris TaxID=56493 RepID=A0A9P6HN41_9AGAM|nr:hypothetical protein BJ322DRAFT_1106725 [Thelephora terrestris]
MLRGVTDHRKSRVGTDEAGGLIKDYTDATHSHSTRRVQDVLTQFFATDLDWSNLENRMVGDDQEARSLQKLADSGDFSRRCLYKGSEA